MAKNPKIELPLRNDFGILCDPKIVPNTNLDTVCFTLPKVHEGGGFHGILRFFVRAYLNSTISGRVGR